MSSFELMELFGATVIDDAEAKTRTIRIDFAPEDGALAMALRDGKRPEWKQMLAQSANIAVLLRQYHAPDADTEVYGEQFFLPTDRLRELEAEQQEREEELRRNQSEEPEPGGLYAMWQA